MRLDRFSNPIFNDNDLINAMFRGQELTNEIVVDYSDQIQSLEQVSGLKFLTPIDNQNISIADFDAAMQSDWHMPDSYKNMDIEGYLVSVCPKENYQRLTDELQEFRARGMLNLLRWMKYFIDTCKANNVVWGVGRGSSVASYVLFLLEVHSVDPLKYKLDWRDFLR